MTAPPDRLALRPTVIAGQRLEDDFVVIWDGISIGRIFKDHGAPADRSWSWSLIVQDQPQPPGAATAWILRSARRASRPPGWKCMPLE